MSTIYSKSQVDRAMTVAYNQTRVNLGHRSYQPALCSGCIGWAGHCTHQHSAEAAIEPAQGVCTGGSSGGRFSDAILAACPMQDWMMRVFDLTEDQAIMILFH